MEINLEEVYFDNEAQINTASDTAPTQLSCNLLCKCLIITLLCFMDALTQG